jgi:hypothetical protein
VLPSATSASTLSVAGDAVGKYFFDDGFVHSPSM